MVGRNKKTKASKRRTTARKNHREARERGEKAPNGGPRGGTPPGGRSEDDGVLFMRAFGRAREVVNVTRILAGLPTKSTGADVRTPDSITLQNDDLLELCVTVDELRPHLQRLVKAKAQSAADKAKDMAEKAAQAKAKERQAAPPKPSATGRQCTALVPLKRGRVVDVNSLYIEASGRAQQVAHYIRILAGLPEQPKRPLETLEIEAGNLEELLVSLEKLSGNFKKGPRARKMNDGPVFMFDDSNHNRRHHPERRYRRRRPTSDRDRARAGYYNRCRYHWPRACTCNDDYYESSDDDYEELVLIHFLHRFFL